MDQNKSYCIYRHVIFPSLKPFYIGLAKGNKRPYHFYSRSKYWYEVADVNEIRVDILLNDLNQQEAELKEREFIALYGRIDKGTGILVNRNGGGRGGNKRIWTDADRKKQSEISKRIKHSPEVIKRMSDKQRGRPVPPERTAKMVATRIKNGGGKWVKSPESCRKQAEAIRGRKQDIELRIKLGKARKKEWSNYKSHSNTPSNKIYNYILYQIHPITHEVVDIHNGIPSAARLLQISDKNIYRSLKYPERMCGGFFWRREYEDGKK